MKFETLISIRGKKPKSQSDNKKTMVLPSRRRQHLGRRRLKPGIRFWDLGYLLSGSTIPFTDPHAGESMSHSTDAISPLSTFDSLTASYYDQISTTIFAYPLADWKTTFFQIDPHYQVYDDPLVRYRGTDYLFSDTDVWDGERLLPDGTATDDSFSVFMGNERFFTGFQINAVGSHTKVTTEFDFSTTDAAFVPSKHMDVFLVPNLMQARLETTHDYILPITDYTIDALDYLRAVYPREVIHDTGLDIYGYDLEFNPFTWAYGLGLSDYEPVYNVTQYWKTNHGSRALRGVHSTFAPDTFADLDPADYADVSMFPAPPSTPSYPAAGTMVAQFEAQEPLEGTLLAVIKKGGTYYYIWYKP